MGNCLLFTFAAVQSGSIAKQGIWHQTYSPLLMPSLSFGREISGVKIGERKKTVGTSGVGYALPECRSDEGVEIWLQMAMSGNESA